MAGRGGHRRTTWKKGKKPPVKKPKGAKHRRTKIKEALGLKGWDQLKEFVDGEGAAKLVREMKKLKGRNYVMAVQAIAEYVKPKLSRIDAKVKSDIDLTKLPVTFE